MSLAAPRLEALIITEIQYHPDARADAEEELEFVEVYNDGSIVADISEFYFSSGIQFAFPAETYLRARSYLVVCANLERFRQVHGNLENAYGNFNGRLDNNGEMIRLSNRTGSPVAELRFRDRAPWPATPDGTGFTLSLLDVLADGNDPSSWTRSARPGGTPGGPNFPPPLPVENEIFPETGPEVLWKYKKGWNSETLLMEEFSSPPEAWRQPGFDDGAWAVGQAPVGFGDPEVASVLPDMEMNYLAFAARRSFTITGEQLEAMAFLTCNVRVDDGCILYFNGVEVGRSGLPGEPGTHVAPDVRSNRARELRTAPIPFTIPKESVRAGENLLAIQVHNSSVTSNDAGFAAAVSYRTYREFAGPPAQSVVINEIISRAPEADRGVELFNLEEATVDASGWKLARDPGRFQAYTLPPGTSIAPRGFLFVPETTLGFQILGETPSLFLFGADGETVLDAATVQDPVVLPSAKQSHARSPDGGSSWWISVAPTPGAANDVRVEDGLVINEIHYHPKIVDAAGKPLPGSERSEFLEIYNRSGRTIALDGFALVSGYNYVFGPGQSLAPGAYLVVARDPQVIRTTHGLPAEQVVGPPPEATPVELDAFGVLGDKGELVRLVDALGNTVDEVHYRDDGDWSGLADEGGSSLELIDPAQDNSRAGAWGPSDESRGAPWFEVAFDGNYVASVGPGAMEPELHLYLVSEGEFLLDGVSITSGNPAVESIVNGGFEVDTRPWRLWGTHYRSFRTTEEAKEGSACLHVIGNGPGNNEVDHIEVETTPPMRAGVVRVHMWARWLRGSNAIHVSSHNNVFGRTVYLPLPPTAGSPGRENTLRAALRQRTGGTDNLGPVISEAIHEPAVPPVGLPITFRAHVTDADGVESVEVLHRLDSATEYTRSPLHDDGGHDDGAAGDGDYAGTIPGPATATVINFWIEARDRAGNVRPYPINGDRLPPRSPPVDVEPLVFVVDAPMESTVHRHRLVINNQNLNGAVVGLNRRFLHSNDPVSGTFIFEESKVYYNVGYRYHGSPWNRPGSPRMFRVNFNGDRPFTDGTKRLNVSRYGSSQNEGTAYHLLERASVPEAPVPTPARYEYMVVKLNNILHSGGGAMAEVRAVDGEYAEDAWPADGDGHLWKMTGKLAFTDAGDRGPDPSWTQLKSYPSGPYTGVGNAENYRFFFNPKLRREEDSFDDLIRLLTTMDRATTPDAGYEEKIEDVLHIESSFRTLIIRLLQDDWDTVDIGNGQNAYLYYAPIEGRHYLVPWDMDHTFGNTSARLTPSSSTFGLGRLYNIPRYRRLYGRIVKELLTGSWTEEHLTRWTTMVNETTGPARVAAGGGIVSFVRTRRQSTISSLLGAGFTARFAFTSPNPTGQQGSVATIRGTAPLEAATMAAALNGGSLEPVEPVWSAPRSQPNAMPVQWEIQVPGLAPERNEVQVIAFDRAGNIVGSGSIDVYDTSAWAAPTIASIEPAAGPEDGGTAVRVLGTGFRVGTTLAFGTASATEVTIVSETELRAVSPRGALGPADVTVAIIDGRQATLTGGFTYGAPPMPQFRRGDASGDGDFNLTDVLVIANYLFQKGSLLCMDAADATDDGRLSLADAVMVLLYLHGDVAAIPEPFFAPGPDPTEDDLACENSV